MVAGLPRVSYSQKAVTREQLEFSGALSIEEMSKKRGAVVQLSKDSVAHASSDEEPEQPPAEFSQSGIPLASQEELSKRKIVKLIGVKKPEAPAPQQEPPRTGLFSGLKLAPAPASAPAPAPSPAPAVAAGEAKEATVEESKGQVEEKESAPTSAPAAAAPKASGFAAYSASNPFAAIAAKQSPKSTNPYSSPTPSTNPFMSFTSGTNSIWAAAASKPFGSSQQIVQEKPKEEKDEDEGEDGKEDVEAEVPVTGPPPPTAALFQAKEVELRTGEEDEVCRLELRSKLYRFGKKETAAGEESKQKGMEWFDVGVGPLRVLVPKENPDGSKAARIVMRRETKPKSGQATKLLLNVLLKGRVQVAQGGEREVRLTCIEMQEEKEAADAGEAEAQPRFKPVVASYMFRLESADKANELLSTLNSLIVA